MNSSDSPRARASLFCNPWTHGEVAVGSENFLGSRVDASRVKRRVLADPLDLTHDDHNVSTRRMHECCRAHPRGSPCQLLVSARSLAASLTSCSTPPPGRTTTTTTCTETCTRPRPRQRPQLRLLLLRQRAARLHQQQLRPPVRPRPRPRPVLLPRLAMGETPPALHSFRRSLPARRCLRREGWSTTLAFRGRRRCRPTHWRQRLPTNSTKGEAAIPLLPISSSRLPQVPPRLALEGLVVRTRCSCVPTTTSSSALDTRTARRTRPMDLAPGRASDRVAARTLY